MQTSISQRHMITVTVTHPYSLLFYIHLNFYNFSERSLAVFWRLLREAFLQLSRRRDGVRKHGWTGGVCRHTWHRSCQRLGHAIQGKLSLMHACSPSITHLFRHRFLWRVVVIMHTDVLFVRLRLAAVCRRSLQRDRFTFSTLWTSGWPGSTWCLSVYLQILAVPGRCRSRLCSSRPMDGSERFILYQTVSQTREISQTLLWTHRWNHLLRARVISEGE